MQPTLRAKAISLSLAVACLLACSDKRPTTTTDPKKALLQKTGLLLPKHAKIVEFEEGGFLDGYMKLRFEVSQTEARRFMRQKPFHGWKTNWTKPDFTPTLWQKYPRPPFDETETDLPQGRHLGAIVERRPSGPWTIWIGWFET